MKNFIITFLISFLSILCSAQDSLAVKHSTLSNIKFLKTEQLSKIMNKEEMRIQKGCIISYITKGEFELNKIFNDSTTSLKNENLIILCRSILQSEDLYHLHDSAGEQLFALLDKSDYDKSLFNQQDKFEYILLRMNHPLSRVLYAGGRFVEIGQKNKENLFTFIGTESFSPKTKKYFIEALYSLTVSQKNGEYINKRISHLNLDVNLMEYNDSLYKAFQKYKPLFENLEAIHTWKEMDKNDKLVQEMFESYHPIMFLQILSFNPSTVLESKKLSQLKQNALISIIKNADKNSFYSSYRLAYLIELLVDRNYSVRFLDAIMSKSEKDKFIMQLEE